MTEPNKAIAVHNNMSLSDVGSVLARSGFFADSKDAAQAIVKILAGQELGLGPVASMTGIYIVKGRVTLSANLIAGAIKRSNKYDFKVTEHDDKHCVIDFYEGSQKIGTSPFSMDDAKRAGLAGDNWQKYPRNMLYARALSNGAKWYTPDVFSGGVYTPDELGETIDGESGEVITVTQAQEETKPQAKPPSREALLARFSELVTEAETHKIEVAKLPADVADEEIIRRGRNLKALIDASIKAQTEQVPA